MTIITIHEAETNLSRLVARARTGEEIIIARGKQPMVRLVPIGGEAGKRVAGLLKEKWPDLSDEFFFDPSPKEESGGWEGRDAVDP